MKHLASAIFAIVLVIVPELAHAHMPIAGAGGFIGGLLHPLFVLQHGLAIFAAGLLIANQPRKWFCLLSFTTGLVAGSIAIAAAYAPIYAGQAVLALAIVLGVVVAIGKPLPEIFPILLAAAAGFAIALNSPPETIDLREAMLMQIGACVGATVLITALAALIALLNRDWQRIGQRIIASWIAASAILVLAADLFH